MPSIDFEPDFDIPTAENIDHMSKLVERLISSTTTIYDWEEEKKKMRCIIVDIDGTISDLSKRIHHIEGMKQDWDKFFKASKNDKPHEWCMRLVQIYHQTGYIIYFITGRPERYRKQTESWLEKYEIPFDFLFMRGDEDKRNDSIVKEEILNSQFKDKSLIEFVIDDRKQVVKMWRKNGLICLQTNPHE